nr:MAG TPA: hypothetical protein [Caudoviricetes sp.]
MKHSSLCNRAKRPSPINSQRKSTAYGWKSKLTTVLSHCRRVKQPRGFMRIQKSSMHWRNAHGLARHAAKLMR